MLKMFSNAGRREKSAIGAAEVSFAAFAVAALEQPPGQLHSACWTSCNEVSSFASKSSSSPTFDQDTAMLHLERRLKDCRGLEH